MGLVNVSVFLKNRCFAFEKSAARGNCEPD